ncbi:MAG: hypothetical protein ACKVIN_04430 [Longimicrobiales bacterium]
MDQTRDILSEEEAARVWRESAQLQAESEGATPAELTYDEKHLPSTSYALEHVRSAAQQAGIAGAFVEAALADVRVERALPPREKSHGLARQFLAHPPNTIAVRRVIGATPEDILTAMQAVLPAEPFRLTLTGEEGDPLDGGVLVFDLPAVRTLGERGFAFAAADAGLRQVFISVHPLKDSPPSCQVIAHSPVTSHNIGFGIGMIAATVTGGAGFAALGALGLTIGIGPIGALGGVLLGVSLGVKGFRALYNSSMLRAQTAFDGLLGAVAARATGVWRG